MAETLYIISRVSFIASAVFAVISAALFFIFAIPSVIGDLSGANARKSIERMRKSNENSSENRNGAGLNKRQGADKAHNKDRAKEHMKGSETVPLFINNDMGAAGMEDATQPLEMMGITEPLNGYPDRSEERKIKFSMIDEIILIHTDEVI